jgi:hypothetical protein
MPRLAGQRRQQQPYRHQADAELHHRARADPVHHAAEHRAQDRRDHEAEGERASGDAAIPMELVEDRREQQRESGAGVDADAHGDKYDGDDHPAVEKWQTHGQYRLPRVARFKREACSALPLRRAPVAAID